MQDLLHALSLPLTLTPGPASCAVAVLSPCCFRVPLSAAVGRYLRVYHDTDTANLAAFFTKSSFQLGGPSSMQELRSSRVCGLHPGYGVWLENFADDVDSPPAELVPLGIDALFERCVEGMRSGRYDIIVHDSAVLLNYLLGTSGDANCRTMHHASWLNILPDRWVFVMRAENATLANLVSAAIMQAKLSPAHVDIQHSALRVGAACPANANGETDPVDLSSMMGLFYISGGLAALAVLCACVQRWLSRMDHAVEVTDADRNKHTKTDAMTDATTDTTTAPRLVLDDSQLQLLRTILKSVEVVATTGSAERRPANEPTSDVVSSSTPPLNMYSFYVEET